MQGLCSEVLKLHQPTEAQHVRQFPKCLYGKLFPTFLFLLLVKSPPPPPPHSGQKRGGRQSYLVTLKFKVMLILICPQN